MNESLEISGSFTIPIEPTEPTAETIPTAEIISTEEQKVIQDNVITISDFIKQYEVYSSKFYEGRNPLTGKFVAGNTARAGFTGPNRRSIIRKKINMLEKITDVQELKDMLLDNWAELLQSHDERIVLYATKEISKYIMPVKMEMSGRVDSNTNVFFNLPATSSLSNNFFDNNKKEDN